MPSVECDSLTTSALRSLVSQNATLSQTDISNLERAALALREVGQSQLLGSARQQAGSPQPNGDAPIAPEGTATQPHEESRSKEKEEKKSKSRKRTEEMGNGQSKDAAAKSKKKKKDKD